jgi:hypothetical protein
LNQRKHVKFQKGIASHAKHDLSRKPGRLTIASAFTGQPLNVQARAYQTDQIEAKEQKQTEEKPRSALQHTGSRG